jgi:hypothetical protein
MYDLNYHIVADDIACFCAYDIEGVRRKASILYEKKGKFILVGHSCHSLKFMV